MKETDLTQMDRLEQMGLLPDCECDVQGHLTAEEVFERWKKHYEEVLK